MIIANDYSWVICTPTKTGTYSLEGTLIDRLKVGRKRVPRHRTDWDGPGRRIMIVRHPYDRWCSMYWFANMHALRGNSIWLSQWAHDINAWTSEWWNRRSHKPHWMWTYNLTEHADEFKPDEIWKTETLQTNLERFLENSGKTLVNVSHRNKTDHRLGIEETFGMLTAQNLEKVIEFCEKDFFTFKYEKALTDNNWHR